LAKKNLITLSAIGRHPKIPILVRSTGAKTEVKKRVKIQQKAYNNKGLSQEAQEAVQTTRPEGAPTPARIEYKYLETATIQLVLLLVTVKRKQASSVVK